MISCLYIDLPALLREVKFLSDGQLLKRTSTVVLRPQATFGASGLSYGKLCPTLKDHMVIGIIIWYVIKLFILYIIDPVLY